MAVLEHLRLSKTPISYITVRGKGVCMHPCGNPSMDLFLALSPMLDRDKSNKNGESRREEAKAGGGGV
jgi:hypothetical protein